MSDTGKEKKVGCPFCSRESNRPNNVVVHILGQHAGLCKEKISRIRSRVPAVALREAMLLFMKDKFETDDIIRDLVEENERLRWSISSFGGVAVNPAMGMLGGGSLGNVASAASGLMAVANAATTLGNVSSSGSLREDMSRKRKAKEKIKYEKDTKKHKGRKRKSATPSSSSQDEEEEEEEAERVEIAEEESEEERDVRDSELCFVTWGSGDLRYSLCLPASYLNTLRDDAVEQEEAEPLPHRGEKVCVLVCNPASNNPSSLSNQKKKQPTNYFMTLEDLRKIFPTEAHSYTVQRSAIAYSHGLFEKILAGEMPASAQPASRHVVGTLDCVEERATGPCVEATLYSKVLSCFGGPAALTLKHPRSQFARSVEQEAVEWEKENAVDRFGKFVILMPKSFGDILLSMHPILENITLAKQVEQGSFSQRIARILHLLSQTKALIQAKIGDYHRQLGRRATVLEKELSIAESFVNDVAEMTPEKATKLNEEELLHSCMLSFVGMKKVLSAFHDDLQRFCCPEEGPSNYNVARSISNIQQTTSCYIPPQASAMPQKMQQQQLPQLSASQRYDPTKRGFSFTQAMSRLLNAIQMCSEAPQSPPQQPSSPPQPQQRVSQPPQPQPPQQQQQQQRKVQAPPSQRSGGSKQQSGPSAHPPGVLPHEMDLQRHHQMLQQQFYAQYVPPFPLMPVPPPVQRPVPVSVLPTFQQGAYGLTTVPTYSTATTSTTSTPSLPLLQKERSAFSSPPRRNSNSPTTIESVAKESAHRQQEHEGCLTVYDRTFVFIVAVDKYQDGRLPPRIGSSDDARQAEAALSKLPGYTLQTIVNEQATKENIRRIFTSELDSARDTDRVLIFFESQGLTTKPSKGEEIGVMCCYDTDPHNPLGTGVRPEELLAWVKKVRHVAMFLDSPFACAGLVPGLTASGKSSSWQSYIDKPAAQYLWSSEVGGGRTGALLKNLVEAFGGPVFDHYSKDWVTMTELSEWVCNAVFRSTKGRLEPQGGSLLSSSSNGEVLFLRPGLLCLPASPQSSKSAVSSPSYMPSSTVDYANKTYYVTLQIKELKYFGFHDTMVNNNMAQAIVEKFKISISDDANGIYVGQSECLDRKASIMASVDEYIKAIRHKAPHVHILSQDIMKEIQTKAQGPVYTISVPCQLRL